MLRLKIYSKFGVRWHFRFKTQKCFPLISAQKFLNSAQVFTVETFPNSRECTYTNFLPYWKYLNLIRVLKHLQLHVTPRFQSHSTSTVFFALAWERLGQGWWHTTTFIGKQKRWVSFRGGVRTILACNAFRRGLLSIPYSAPSLFVASLTLQDLEIFSIKIYI